MTLPIAVMKLLSRVISVNHIRIVGGMFFTCYSCRFVSVRRRGAVNPMLKADHHGPSLTRRGLLRAGSCALCCALGCESITGAAAAPRYFDGCFITSEGYQEFVSQRE